MEATQFPKPVVKGKQCDIVGKIKGHQENLELSHDFCTQGKKNTRQHQPY